MVTPPWVGKGVPWAVQSSELRARLEWAPLHLPTAEGVAWAISRSCSFPQGRTSGVQVGFADRFHFLIYIQMRQSSELKEHFVLFVSSEEKRVDRSIPSPWSNGNAAPLAQQWAPLNQIS